MILFFGNYSVRVLVGLFPLDRFPLPGMLPPSGHLPFRLFLASTAGLAALFPAAFGLGLSWNHLPSRVLPCHFLLRQLPCLRLTGLVDAVHLASLSLGGTSHSESNGRH